LLVYKYSSLFEGFKQQEINEEFGRYKDVKATIFPHYSYEIPLLIVNALSVAVSLVRQDLQHTGKWSDWGQSAQLTLCMSGFCHWYYTCSPVWVELLVKHKDGRFRKAIAAVVWIVCGVEGIIHTLWSLITPMDMSTGIGFGRKKL
jgi:hypothetical protein